MKEVTVIIERGEDGTYGAYLADDSLPFGLLGDGKTVEETIQDFYNSRDEMKAYYQEEGKIFPEIEFVFKFDMASFLQYYSTKLSLAGLERITGVNQGQLSHYINGYRKPSKKTLEKIENSLHEFGKEISQISFF